MDTNPQVQQKAIMEYLQRKIEQQAMQIIKLEAEYAKLNAINEYHVKIIADATNKSDESLKQNNIEKEG